MSAPRKFKRVFGTQDENSWKDWSWTFEEFIDYLKSIAAEIPEEYRHTAKIEFDPGDLEVGTARLTVVMTSGFDYTGSEWEPDPSGLESDDE